MASHLAPEGFLCRSYSNPLLIDVKQNGGSSQRRVFDLIQCENKGGNDNHILQPHFPGFVGNEILGFSIQRRDLDENIQVREFVGVAASPDP